MEIVRKNIFNKLWDILAKNCGTYKFTCTDLILLTHQIYCRNFLIESLPNDKILDWSKLKAFPSDKIIVNSLPNDKL